MNYCAHQYQKTNAVLNTVEPGGTVPAWQCSKCKLMLGPDEVIEYLAARLDSTQKNFEATKLCTRCGYKYDASGTCTNKPCQGGRGEWCIEHHGAPFALGTAT